MAPKTSVKRKEPPTRQTSERPRAPKRAKIKDARTILAETSDKALNENGDLDVTAFVKAREFEIKAMCKNMEQSKTVLSTRAFQHVPRSMRRRTASHNVKKVPKRLRARAAKEMKDDNTPTGKARRKKLTTHKRLRLEKAKALKAKGRLKKAQRAAARKPKLGETDPEKMVQLVPRLPNQKKNTLVAPSRPPARFRKRQVHKSWLPTHVWHAKRAHMTEPQFPLWRFAIPLSPNEKTFRTTHRAANMRGCVAWDTSYMSTIGLEGIEASLLGLLRSMGFSEEMLTGAKGQKWRRGARSHEAWIRERDKTEVLIAPVTVVWCVVEGSDEGVSEERKKKVKRRMLLRVHPSAFFQTWKDIIKLAKMQRPPVLVEDLRFELGSIEVTGTQSTEALIAALQPTPESFTSSSEAATAMDEDSRDQASEAPAQDAWEDFEKPQTVWTQLAGLTNCASLPPKALLGFNVQDPRLRAPVRTISLPSPDSANSTLLNLLADWPPDSTQGPAAIFDHSKRLTASRLLASQKSINRRKSDCKPGTSPTPSLKDPQIPVLLYATRPPISSAKSGQGKWTILMPWDCILPVWYTLMHYPLSTGETPRFGCLDQQRQIAFENNTLWFPGDLPGTKAGWEWETLERQLAKKQWERKPKGRRVEHSSLRLGDESGNKGEIGKGWACDWERLVLGKKRYEELAAEREKTGEIDHDAVASQAGDVPQQQDQQGQQNSNNDDITFSPQTDLSIPPGPPHNITQILSPRSSLTPSPNPALTPIIIHLLPSGHPSRCARIYRLPTQNPNLLKRWLALAPKPNNSGTRNRKNPHRRDNKGKSTTTLSSARVGSVPLIDMPPHARAQHIAASLAQAYTSATDSSTQPAHVAAEAAAAADPAAPPSRTKSLNIATYEDVKPGHPAYPPVPGEEDLIGFVTSANFRLGEGKCGALGSVLVEKLEFSLGVRGKMSEREGAKRGGGVARREGAVGLDKDKREGGGAGDVHDGEGGQGGQTQGEELSTKDDSRDTDRVAPSTTTAVVVVDAGKKDVRHQSGKDMAKGKPNGKVKGKTQSAGTVAAAVGGRAGGGFCIVREAGLPVGRLARWQFLPG